MREFIIFGLKEARACIFPAMFFAVLILSKKIHVPGVARYDVIFFAAIAIQIGMIATKLETFDELKVICVFHVIGLALELFKTSAPIHSWSYPEACLFKIENVPLYSGFMYAAIGSYLCQAWRIFDVDLVKPPSPWLTVPLSLMIYANFFTHHFIPDFRWVLIALVFLVYFRTRVLFTVTTARRSMPLALAFLLIGFFVWVAENFSTYWGAWVYPNQAEGWKVVSLGKITSWGLLVIISFIIVADLKHLKGRISGKGG